MASVKKIKNTWYAVYYVNGVRKEKTTKIKANVDPTLTGRNKAKAEENLKYNAALIAQELEKLANGDPVNESLLESLIGQSSTRSILGTTALQGCRAFLKEWHRKRNVNDPSKDDKAIRQFVAFLGNRADTPIDKITKQDAIDFMNQELIRVSAGTVERYLQSLRTAFQTAVDARLFTYNPFTKVNPQRLKIKEDKNEGDAFTIEQIQKLIAELPQNWSDMVQICLQLGGLRFGDVCTLKWEQFNLETSTFYGVAQKNKAILNKPLLEQAKQIIARRMQSKVNEYVFPEAYMQWEQAGGKVNKLSIQFNKYLLSLGMIEPQEKQAGDRKTAAKLTFHSIRRSCVSFMRNANVPADVCRALVGHESEEVQRVYYRADEESLKKGLAALEL